MEMDEVVDRQQIVDLVTRYTRAVDTRNFDDLHAVFTEDGIVDYSSPGGPVGTVAEVKDWVAKGLAGFDRYQHVIGQLSIAFTGEERAAADVTAYFTNPMVAVAPDGTETLFEVGGYYHHEVVRTPDGWRSRRMVDDLVWSRGF